MSVRRLCGVTFKVWSAAFVALFIVVGSASADVVEVPVESATSGIAVGPDGNIWAAEPFADQVVRISPTGQVLAHYSVAGEPEGVTAGPGGRVWVAVTGGVQLVWFDATSVIPSAHPINTASASLCGPVGVADGGDGYIYFSAPTDGTCNGGVNAIGRVKADGSSSATGLSGAGESFGLAAYGGKLFAPEFEADSVNRINLSSFSSETEVSLPAGSGPATVAVSPGGEVWTSLLNSNQVARFPATQNGGAAAVVPLAPGLLVEPGGIVFGTDGAAYVASTGNSSLVSVTAAGTATSIPLPSGSEPYELAATSDGSIWISDIGESRILRFTPAPPPGPGPQPGPSPSPAPAGPSPVPPTGMTPTPAPRAIIGGKKSQALADSVSVSASCAVGTCKAVATGHVEVKAHGSRKAKSYPLRVVQSTVTAGRDAVLKLKLLAKTKKAVKAALASGGMATAKVQLTVIDSAGKKSTPALLSIKLTRTGKK